MAFIIDLADNGKYLMIRAAGDLTISRMRKAAIAVQAKSAQHGVSKFLFDLRNARNVESVARNYTFVYTDMARLNISRTAKSAILVAPDDRSHDFMETLCRNAGYNVMLFTDMADAIAWLDSGPDKDSGLSTP